MAIKRETGPVGRPCDFCAEKPGMKEWLVRISAISPNALRCTSFVFCSAECMNEAFEAAIVRLG